MLSHVRRKGWCYFMIQLIIQINLEHLFLNENGTFQDSSGMFLTCLIILESSRSPTI